MKKEHSIKIYQEHYNAIIDKNKKAEIRYNDRNYETGDTIKFCNIHTSFPIDERTWLVTHVCAFVGLKEGYVMLSLKEQL